MSQLNFIEKLLGGVEVEWKPLSGIATITIGEFVHKNKQDPNAKYPVYNGGTSPTGYYEKYNNIGDKIIVSARGANAGFVNRISQPYWAGNSCYSVGAKNSDEINWTYIFYCLKNCENRLIGDQQKGGIPAISKKQMEVFNIPIPCPENKKKSLEIQAEIVRILNTFTELTTELTTELSARKKQYNFFREKLLSSDLPSSKETTLGKVLDMRAGKHIKAKDISAIKNTEHKYTCFGGNGSRGFVQEYSHEGDYALIGRQGALCGNVKRTTGKFYATEHAVVCTPKQGIDMDWAFHILTFMNLNQYKSQSAQPGLAVGNLANLAINVPPISEQKEIAKILNKFDTITSSISEGLPREIKLRQQQYEYYRDLLLSFLKPESELKADA